MTRQQRHTEGGYILMLVLVSAFAFTVALMGITNLAFATYKSARQSMLNLSALAIAEGGGDAAVVALNAAANASSTYEGTTPPSSNVCALASSSAKSAGAVTVYDNATQGKATYETCIEDNTVINDPADLTKNRYEKVLYSVGKIYQPSTAATPRAVSRVKLILEGSPSGDYSVHTGPGGLVMTSSATVTNGNVYVGGSLSMSNTSHIGTLVSPSIVNVANYDCPKTAPYSGYPALCASGSPITINNSAHIYGTVNANGQTSGDGMSDPGLVLTSGVNPVSLPGYNRVAHKNAVTTTINGSQSCSGNTEMTLQANTKINGDLTLSNNCILYLRGDLWITGKITATQKALIITDPSVTSMVHIMIDSADGINLNQQSGMAANELGAGFEVITTYSTAACGNDCTSVTGADLVNSMTYTTIDLNNQSLAAGTTFYALWTSLSLKQGGTVGAIMAQKIYLANSGAIAFGQNAVGTTTYSWNVRYYEQMPVRDAQTTN